MNKFVSFLYTYQDKGYAEFECKLIPTLSKEKCIGVRVPKIREIAKKLKDDPETKFFLSELPHNYFDENMLHGLFISQIKDFSECVKEVNIFLPYVDNWAVCDIMSPKIFAKHKSELIKNIKVWAKDKWPYTVRFALGMLMAYYLDDDFKPEYLNIAASIKSSEYYVNMMIAWYFATALAKKWDQTLPFLSEKKLSPWVNNKTISKARDSRRLTSEQKELLLKYKQ